MTINTDFTWATARQTADLSILQQFGKHLSDLEILVLRGAWDNQTYEEIAAAEGYTSNYLSKDVGNKLWNNLSLALQEKVSKKNFKAALQREWYKQTQNSLGDCKNKCFQTKRCNLPLPPGSVGQ